MIAVSEITAEDVHIMHLSAPADEIAGLLHEVAEFFQEHVDACLIGMWSTGFGQPWEITLQVVYTMEQPDDDGS